MTGSENPGCKDLETSGSAEVSSATRRDGIKTVQSVRVSIERLDNLMNLVGELIINKSRLNQLATEIETKNLDEALANLDRLTNDIQVEIMDARMVPIDQIFKRFPRMVRDLAKSQNKKINFVTEGNEIELDRTVLDEIGDPMVHLLRNAVDHGIEDMQTRISKGKSETGSITLKASRQRNNIIIEVNDDGKGMDPENIRKVAVEKGIISRSDAGNLTDRESLYLIFEAGFSEAKQITDISGRGVGMDVVRTKIEGLGGLVEVESTVEKGSSIKLRLPLTVAIIQSLLVRVSDEKYAIPINNIVRDEVIKSSDIKTIKGEKVAVLRGEVLPIVWLHDLLDIPVEDASRDNLLVVVVEKMGDSVGLVVDRLLGQQEVIIKNLDNKLLKDVRGFSGATILGDGQVALILDISTLI